MTAAARIMLAGFLASISLAALPGVASAQEPHNRPGGKDKKQEPLSVGTLAPDFELLDPTGQKRKLSDYQGKKAVALVFYPAMFRKGG